MPARSLNRLVLRAPTYSSGSLNLKGYLLIGRFSSLFLATLCDVVLWQESTSAVQKRERPIIARFKLLSVGGFLLTL
jgi:hypothetical protein